MIGSNDFNFSQDELDLLFSIKHCALKETIREYRVGALSSLIRSKETTVKKEDETKTLKTLWLKEWHDKTTHLLKDIFVTTKKLVLICGYTRKFKMDTNLEN